ncbi:hypothetical protein [Acetanaerobacterium elongatum]|uniref:Uncharacterized protein n=1 Tax=Acetanaerobacterium elongatum TaxID=258515 RepID=A0A1G9XCR3_9FIRM|nr:hypothetical protein [Acetanaerobacterium elongatum]SDM94592.1 hypothetical protein SAMN05192585_10835 [Acetanaerobacterium elongatum]
MKRLTALFLCLLCFLCACTAPGVQTVSSTESAVSSAANSKVLTAKDSGVSSAAAEKSGSSKTINTKNLTEEMAKELLRDLEDYMVYRSKYGYVLSSVEGATANFQPLADWINCYKCGIPSEVVIFYRGRMDAYFYVLTSNGTAEYTITRYGNSSPTLQFKSSVITERTIDYIFGSDITQDEQMPFTIRKGYDFNEVYHVKRYENAVATFATANLKTEPFCCYIYDTNVKTYTKKHVDSKSITTIRDFFAPIEETLPFKLQIRRIVQDGDLVFISFARDCAPVKGLAKGQEQAVLYSLAKTVLENQKDVLGVCFEVEESLYQSDNFDCELCELCIPPQTSLPGLSTQAANTVAKEGLSELLIIEQDADNTDVQITIRLRGAEFINGVLCYVFDTFRNGIDHRKIGVEPASGGAIFVNDPTSPREAEYLILRDNFEKQITLE